MKETPEQSIAAPLFVYLASGGTSDSAITELPSFRVQLQAALDWMKSKARCTTADVECRASRLREVIQRKDDAVMRSDFDQAAELRAEECAILGSVGLVAPTGETWHTVLRVSAQQQIRQLSELLCQNTKQ